MLLIHIAVVLAALSRLCAAVVPGDLNHLLDNDYAHPSKRMIQPSDVDASGPASPPHTCLCATKSSVTGMMSVQDEGAVRRMIPLTNEALQPIPATSQCEVLHDTHAAKERRMAPPPSVVDDTLGSMMPRDPQHTCSCAEPPIPSSCSIQPEQVAAPSLVTIKSTTIQYITVEPTPTSSPQLSYVTVHSTTVQFVTVTPPAASVIVSTVVQLNHQIVAVHTTLPAPPAPSAPRASVEPAIVLVAEGGLGIKRENGTSGSGGVHAEDETWALMLSPLSPQNRSIAVTAIWNGGGTHEGQRILDGSCRCIHRSMADRTVPARTTRGRQAGQSTHLSPSTHGFNCHHSEQRGDELYRATTHTHHHNDAISLVHHSHQDEYIPRAGKRDHRNFGQGIDDHADRDCVAYRKVNVCSRPALIQTHTALARNLSDD